MKLGKKRRITRETTVGVALLLYYYLVHKLSGYSSSMTSTSLNGVKASSSMSVETVVRWSLVWSRDIQHDEPEGVWRQHTARTAYRVPVYHGNARARDHCTEFPGKLGRGYFAGGRFNFSGQPIRETVQEQHTVAWPPSGDTPINGLVCVLNGPEKLRKV